MGEQNHDLENLFTLSVPAQRQDHDRAFCGGPSPLSPLFRGALCLSVATRACSLPPYRARTGGGYKQILVIAVTTAMEGEYGPPSAKTTATTTLKFSIAG